MHFLRTDRTKFHKTLPVCCTVLWPIDFLIVTVVTKTRNKEIMISRSDWDQQESFMYEPIYVGYIVTGLQLPYVEHQ